MEQEYLLITGDPDRVVPKSIQEDEISRDGGRWPEYAHTMILCVDDFGGRLAQGRLYSFCEETPRLFHSMDQLLFELVSLLDENNLVMGSMHPRRIRQSKKQTKGELEMEQTAPPKQAPAWPFMELRPRKGGCATFYLRVYSRQNASLQGFLALNDPKTDPMAFRSALELLQMIREVLMEKEQNRTVNEDDAKTEL